jgi:hypothetical protein
VKLIPVDHDPFSEEDDSFRAANEVVQRFGAFAEETKAQITTMAYELHAKLDAVRSIARELNGIARELHSTVMPALAAEIEAAKNLKGNDKSAREGEQPEDPKPVEVIRDQRGQAVKIIKGNQTFDIERTGDRIVRIVPEGEPKPPRSKKRFTNKESKQ